MDTQTTAQSANYQIEAARLRNEYPAEPGERRDPYSAYIEVEVDVLDDGERTTYEIAAVVGVPEHLRGTMHAAGTGPRPYVQAWFECASDTDDLPRGDIELRAAIESALCRHAWRLYREAMSDRADEDEDDN